MKELFYILFILFLGNSCQKTDYNPSSNYIIIDTIPITDGKIESFWRGYEDYPLLFLGKLKDTVNVGYEYFFLPMPPPSREFFEGLTKIEDDTASILEFKFDSVRYLKDLKEYKNKIANHILTKFQDSIKNNNIQPRTIYTDSVSIFVDTAYIISKIGSEYNVRCPAYPVIIANNLEDTISLDIEREFACILEAKDSLDNWVIIKSYLPFRHATCYFYKMPPSYTAITATYVTQGNYETKLRLRVGNNISNEWRGKINYNQFNSMFNSSGNYSEEYLKWEKEIKKNAR